MINNIRELVSLPARLLQISFLILVAMMLSACATYEYHSTENVPISRMEAEAALAVAEDQLLDVGIVVFDPGVDIMDDVSAAYSNVRESEAVWFTGLLKGALDRSRAWGLVRAVPSSEQLSDVTVSGRIVDSSGEVLAIQISVQDASGKVWFANEYSERASSYSYDPNVDLKRDPFQGLFNRVANDMFDVLASLGDSELSSIREITKVRFAREFAPASFAGFLAQNEEGEYSLQRVPAANDPMMLRVDKIQARNELFLDVIQDYYRVFSRNMSSPYEEWRKLSYKEVVRERQLRKQAKTEKIAGVAVVALGLLASGSNSRATRFGGHIGMWKGATLFAKGFMTQIEASLHAEAVRELGESLEAELEPSVIDLQDRSVTLTGTVQDQYREWRRILTEMFEAEERLQNDSADLEGEREKDLGLLIEAASDE